MIIALTTPAHDYTFKVVRKLVPGFRTMDYASALHARGLPRATYLFCDVDRLSYWELELAARLYRQLKSSGVRVFNDPARVRQRYALLRTLKDRGLNRFDVWLPDHGQEPDRFPVFLRTQSAHRGPLTDLLQNSEAARSALSDAIAQGHARKDLMFVEYCAEPTETGVFRKLSVFKVGDAIVPSLAVHESKWAAKYGEIGIAGDAGYIDEHKLVVENRFAAAMAPVFDVSEIQYGRADFALVGGSPQTYEVNTNPSIKAMSEHPSALRMEAQRVMLDKLKNAFEAIDSPPGASIVIDDPVLAHQRRRDRLYPYIRWNA
jgi:hypothetical protein